MAARGDAERSSAQGRAATPHKRPDGKIEPKWQLEMILLIKIDFIDYNDLIDGNGFVY